MPHIFFIICAAISTHTYHPLSFKKNAPDILSIRNPPDERILWCSFYYIHLINKNPGNLSFPGHKS